MESANAQHPLNAFTCRWLTVNVVKLRILCDVHMRLFVCCFFCYCCKCDFASADLDCCAATLYIFYCYCNLYLQLSNAGLSECWHIDTFMSTCVCVPFVDYVYAICWLIVFAFACCCWFGEMLLLLLWTHVRMCSCMCSCELWWQIVVVPAIVVVVGRLLRTKAVAAILNLLTNNTY